MVSDVAYLDSEIANHLPEKRKKQFSCLQDNHIPVHKYTDYFRYLDTVISWEIYKRSSSLFLLIVAIVIKGS